MASKAAYRRLMKEYMMIQKNPVEFVEARPAPDNILEWHYIITGPPDTPYEGGQYHGTLTFPSEYPYKPPAIRMVTPSGRFRTNTKLCLSFSDFHPNLWNPSWMVSTILVGLISFMTSEEMLTGGLTATRATRQDFARDSKRFNAQQNPKFARIFPELVEKNNEDIAANNLPPGSSLEDNLNADGPITPAIGNADHEETTTSEGARSSVGANQNQENVIKRHWKKIITVLAVLVLAHYIGPA
ncbi:ubiquitin conjugating enzyme Ubc6 [Schizosaccharomyces japonicus yFS275]|uniref:Ubiquitin-conjugating enzyme E2 6 n=1 Tax=Schizosaccharomyces japonicus (strain yFS275 / FY16936) TaxID=402676 RepID=B6K8E4_SCHJY|nr:ubiquitin conjugating enzyme Ubc6 [Schizosaccharomyces japonicus yFS275]EEB09798.2 ubiquitin conjugating enzyme Ubc6 [Schizosaccharomyces japonicus yFS275]